MTTTPTAAARVSGTIKALMDALSSAIEWIDAVPSDTPLPTMPGFDRDAVDSLLAAIQSDPEPKPVACPVDHSDMATSDCPKCGAFQDAAPSSAGTVSVEALIDVLHCCDTEAAEIANRIAGRRGQPCRHPDGVQVLEDAETIIRAALRALAGEADAP